MKIARPVSTALVLGALARAVLVGGSAAADSAAQASGAGGLNQNAKLDLTPLLFSFTERQQTGADGA